MFRNKAHVTSNVGNGFSRRSNREGKVSAEGIKRGKMFQERCQRRRLKKQIDDNGQLVPFHVDGRYRIT